MTRPQRPCLDCGALHREPGPRCRTHELAHQRARNAKRPQYTGAWAAYSRRRRRDSPICARCGATTDLTLDHETNTVECRSCNSSHRRNPA